MKTQRAQSVILPYIEQDNVTNSPEKETGSKKSGLAETVLQQPEASEKSASQAAEIKQQAGARAAELHAQLDKPGPEDQEGQNNIIAILIG